MHGNESRLMKGFAGPDGKMLPRHKQQLFVAVSQSSMQKRRDKCRGTGSINQVEFLWVITKSQFDVPEKNASTRRPPRWETCWDRTSCQSWTRI